MLISIIIPAYNYGQYLERALQSILSQQNTDVEIIVVDDGSTDNTQAMMQSYIQQYPQLHFLSQQHQGPGKARNLGANNAKSSWLLFLDADDYLVSDALAIFKQAINDHPQSNAILAGHIKQGRHRQFKKISGPHLSLSAEENFSDFITEALRLYQGAFIIRRDIFTALGGYPENIYLCEDKVLWGRLIANYPIASIPQAVVTLCDHPGRLREDGEKRRKEAVSYVELLFNPLYLPAPFLKYKKVAYARVQLSLVKNFYQHQQHRNAVATFHQALKTSLIQCLRLQLLKYYFLALLKVLSGALAKTR